MSKKYYKIKYSYGAVEYICGDDKGTDVYYIDTSPEFEVSYRPLTVKIESRMSDLPCSVSEVKEISREEFYMGLSAYILVMTDKLEKLVKSLWEESKEEENE